MDTQKVLKERGNKYGTFTDNAQFTQQVMRELSHFQFCYNVLTNEHKEAIHMIVHKISRAVSGDILYDDNWIDIIGYTQLLIDFIKLNNLQNEKYISIDKQDYDRITTPFIVILSHEKYKHIEQRYYQIIHEILCNISNCVNYNPFYLPIFNRIILLSNIMLGYIKEQKEQ